MGVIEIMEFFGEQRPRKCKHCSRTFAKDFFKPHMKLCSPAVNMEMIPFDKTSKLDDSKEIALNACDISSNSTETYV